MRRGRDRKESTTYDGPTDGELFPGDESPELDYPCPWSYRVIGRDEDRLRQAIDDVAFALHYSVTTGNRSRAGSYVSLHVQVKVDGDEQRRDIFWRLAEHPDVAWVL